MMHKKCSIFGWICLILTVIGGINWGLVGIFGYNLVYHLVGTWPAVERIIYIVVGVASIILIFLAGSKCLGRCKTGQVCDKCKCKEPHDDHMVPPPNPPLS